MKNVKKNKVSQNSTNTKSNPPSKTKIATKESSEKVAQAPVFETAAHSEEDHEILQLLSKKSGNKPKNQDIDYIPELERGDIDITEG
ncbi:hypothetical protein A2W32_05140 [candidate division WWE3 bacterium RBG_16_37_10]|uniref:Uncharacterized protein n=1 Tax=candidate division WWE3 bacterium RBG_16_37_10 TaxID=1802610 RepID=A0A1F4V584_UNCKA|nr:MAG: hypothetical protein A2W32_05140 [candidate division WWE3 bacterium RBG_16_37_10]